MLADVKVSRDKVASCHVVTSRNAVNLPSKFRVYKQTKKLAFLNLAGKRIYPPYVTLHLSVALNVFAKLNRTKEEKKSVSLLT